MFSPITILWFISSLLACWCFSLIVRLLSEAGARKRKRLVAKHTAKEIRLALLLIGIASIGSVAAGYAAVYEQSTQDSYYTGGHSVLAAIGGAAGLFAVCLMIWAAIGDRARGRIRCPKCWYDMSESMGLRCPECGKAVENEKDYYKSRRPRWGFVVGAFMLIFGGLGLSLDEKVSENGVLSLLPNSMMLMTWESLPENWVYYTGVKGRKSNFTDRIRFNGISTEQIRQLGNELVDRMILDINARWDPKNHAVLNAVYLRSTQDWYNNEDKSEGVWMPTENRLELLYNECARDVHDALTTEKPTTLQFEIVDTDPRRYYSRVDVYAVCRDWIAHALHERSIHRSYQRIFFPDTSELLQSVQSALDPIREQQDPIDLIEIYTSANFKKSARAFLFTMDFGYPEKFLDDAFVTWEAADEDIKHLVVLSHVLAMNSVDESVTVSELERLEEYITGSDPHKRAYALRILVPLSRIEPLDGAAVREARDSLIRATVALYDESSEKEAPQGEVAANQLMFDLLVEAITAYDDRGVHSFRVVSDLIRQTGKLPGSIDEYMFYFYENTDERIGQWVKHFEPISRIPNSFVQAWIAEHCPERTGTPFDQKIDDMLIRLEQVEDVEVSNSAFLTQTRRSSYQDRNGQ